jgi:hypothetical protein
MINCNFPDANWYVIHKNEDMHIYYANICPLSRTSRQFLICHCYTVTVSDLFMPPPFLATKRVVNPVKPDFRHFEMYFLRKINVQCGYRPISQSTHILTDLKRVSKIIQMHLFKRYPFITFWLECVATTLKSHVKRSSGYAF